MDLKYEFTNGHPRTALAAGFGMGKAELPAPSGSGLICKDQNCPSAGSWEQGWEFMSKESWDQAAQWCAEDHAVISMRRCFNLLKIRTQLQVFGFATVTGELSELEHQSAGIRQNGRTADRPSKKQWEKLCPYGSVFEIHQYGKTVAEWREKQRSIEVIQRPTMTRIETNSPHWWVWPGVNSKRMVTIKMHWNNC